MASFSGWISKIMQVQTDEIATGNDGLLEKEFYPVEVYTNIFKCF